MATRIPRAMSIPPRLDLPTPAHKRLALLVNPSTRRTHMPASASTHLEPNRCLRQNLRDPCARTYGWTMVVEPARIATYA